MNPGSRLNRLAAMGAGELRFRAVCEARKAAQRMRFSVVRPTWRRSALTRALDPATGALIAAAAAAAARGDHIAAHRALARHFTTRERRWPIAAPVRSALVAGVRRCFPSADQDARARADRVAAGRYDLLGFRDLPLGQPPDWHADVVHARRAPHGYWASIPYLDPQSGDHKVIWEINRHQQFLPLGAAYWLSGDERHRDTFIVQLEDWLLANPPLDGANWASMLELAFRSLSWTWAVEFFCDGADADTTPWLVDLVVALDRQLAHVQHNLSTYFSPNTHISGEALALYAVSSAFPELRASAERAAIGRELLIREAGLQVRSDGGHAELSSHYHRYSTDFYLLALLVARCTGDPAAASFEAAVRAQAGYLRTIADDHGRLPHVGDDDGGQLFKFGNAAAADASATLSAAAAALGDAFLAVTAPTPDVHWILGEAPGTVAAPASVWPSRLLRDTGYFVSRANAGHLIFDAGPHGFLNGGHAHADALSIVLTVGDDPLLVDPGTATYTMDAEARDRFRSPAMHNTVTIDGLPFAEPQGPFTWRSHTDARMLVARTGPCGDFAVGAHDGYGFPHARAVIVVPGGGWLIVDWLMPSRGVRADARWHLAPEWRATAVESGFRLVHASGRTLGLATTATDRSTENSLHSMEYGRVDPATALRTSVAGVGPLVLGTFVPFCVASALPVLRLIESATEGVPSWTLLSFAIVAETETLVRIAFPRDLQAGAALEKWPQPCIHQPRATCVE